MQPPGQPPLPAPALFDLLTDPDPAGPRHRHGYDLRDLADAVQRDLEQLLNTGQAQPDMPNAFVETRNSVAAYGLPEVVTRRLSDPQEQTNIARVIEETVRRFEPRLDEVVVSPDPSGSGGVANLRFRLRARFRVYPSADLAFDTVLELSTGRCRVKRSSEAS